MSDLAKRYEYGRRAERRTEVFLLNDFWVMKLSVDLNGAVFLVQPATPSIESMRKQAGSRSFAAVQSLCCTEGAEIEVPRILVERSDRQPHKEFFVSIHVLDRFGVASDYFFSAEEVQNSFKRKSNQNGQDVLVFGITEEKNFSQFQRKHRDRVQMISKSLSEVEFKENQVFLERVLECHGSGPVQQPLIQVSENQWQMRLDQTLFEFERDENEIIHGSKTDPSGQRQLTPFLPTGSFQDFTFDPFNEEWIQRNP